MIEIKNTNSEDYEREVLIRLKKFNKSHCDYFSNMLIPPEEKVNFIAFDDGVFVGGAVGVIKYNWYYLDLLFVDEKMRGQKLGSKLIMQIEEFARARGLTGVRMETWEFQARGFYEKLGYTVFGEIANCPPGVTEYHLKKEFDYNK